MPRAHQSTVLEWPLPSMTSGARYSKIYMRFRTQLISWQLITTNPRCQQMSWSLNSRMALCSAWAAAICTSQLMVSQSALFSVTQNGSDEWMMEGEPAAGDCTDKSKSDSMRWPDSCSKMSNQEAGEISGRWQCLVQIDDVLSGFKSRKTMPIRCRYSRPATTSAA